MPLKFLDINESDAAPDGSLQSANEGNPFIVSANDGNANITTANE